MHLGRWCVLSRCSLTAGAMRKRQTAFSYLRHAKKSFKKKKKDEQFVLLQCCMQHKQLSGMLYHGSQQTAVSAEMWERGVLGWEGRTP